MLRKWSKDGQPLLTDAEKVLQGKLEELRNQIEGLETQERDLIEKHKCVAKNDDPKDEYSGATCAICNEPMEWWCPKNNKTHQCVYKDSRDFCIYCGQPEERK